MGVGYGLAISILGGFVYLIISFLLLEWWNPMLTIWGRMFIVIYFISIVIVMFMEE